jgi:hypothetical protein
MITAHTAMENNRSTNSTNFPITPEAAITPMIPVLGTHAGILSPPQKPLRDSTASSTQRSAVSNQPDALEPSPDRRWLTAESCSASPFRPFGALDLVAPHSQGFALG